MSIKTDTKYHTDNPVMKCYVFTNKFEKNE